MSWLFGGSPSRTTAPTIASWQGASSLTSSLLQLSIPSTHVARPLDNGRPFTVFDIRVQYELRAWSMRHRFSEFKVLAQVLHERYAGRAQLPLLPGENLLMHALGERELVEHRREALQAYLLRLVQAVPLQDDCLAAFLGLETLCPAHEQPEFEPEPERAARAPVGPGADAAAGGAGRPGGQAEPAPFSWELLWEGAVGKLSYDRRDQG